MKPGIVAAVVLSAILAAAPAGAEKIVITGEEEETLVVRNLHKPGAILIRDVGFPSGGADKGTPGDGAVIPLRRASQVMGSRESAPDHLLIGVAAKKPGTPVDLTLTFICKGNERWDYATKIGVFWNTAKLAQLNSNTGEAAAPADFTVAVPGELVREKNLLWIAPLEEYRAAYFDAAVISSAGPVSLLKKAETEALAEKEIPYWKETRDLSGKGKVLLLNGYGRMVGHWEYDLLKTLNTDLTVVPKDHWAKETWLPPAQWSGYAMVVLIHRHVLTREENDAIGAYLAGGGTLITDPGTVTWMVMKDGPKRGEIEWLGEWKEKTTHPAPYVFPVGKGAFIGIPASYGDYAPEHIAALRTLIAERLEQKKP